jgi:3-phosphoshikimate 1-carboxyvinyltransferase
MRVRVSRSNINGIITPPPSKSYTHRAVAIASLAEGVSYISNPLFSRDTLATINACKILGAEIKKNDNLIIDGKHEFDAGDREINAQNSGTTIRIATAISSLVKEGKTVLTGEASLRKRPMKPLLDALRELGVNCSTNEKPPVIVYGGGIKGGSTTIRGDVSSQFISALLIASIYAKDDVTINVIGEQVSKPYIDATIAVMNRFNVNIKNENYKRYYIKRQEYKPTNFIIPPDFSSIAILLAIGALLGEVTIKSLDRTLPQADAKIIDILKNMDADINANDSISIREKQLSDIDLDLSNSPDLLPVVAILALKAKHVRIRGVKHARVKETDRIAIIAKEFSKLGVDVKEYEDGLEINTPSKIKNAVLDAHDDHRLFMVFTIAGMLTSQSIIDGLESVDVSYPNFIDDIGKLGAKIEII